MASGFEGRCIPSCASGAARNPLVPSRFLPEPTGRMYAAPGPFMKASRSVSSSIGRDTASAVPSKSGRSHHGSGTYGSSLAAHSPRARFSSALSTEALARRLIVTHPRAPSRADTTPGVYPAGGRHRRHLDRHREQRRCSGRREDGRRHHGLRGLLHRLRGQPHGMLAERRLATSELPPWLLPRRARVSASCEGAHTWEI